MTVGNTQRGIVLRLLEERGSEGVNVREFIYNHGITDTAAIVFKLRKEGRNIVTHDEGKTDTGARRLATYELLNPDGSHRAPKPPPDPDAPVELKPLELACGCVRAADGRSWKSRCETHSGYFGS